MARDYWLECERCGGTGKETPGNGGGECEACHGRRGKWVQVPLDYGLYDPKMQPWENWVFLAGLAAALVGIGVIGGIAIAGIMFGVWL